MGQRNSLFWDLPAMDAFAVNRAVYRIPPAQYRETLAGLPREARLRLARNLGGHPRAAELLDRQELDDALAVSRRLVDRGGIGQGLAVRVPDQIGQTAAARARFDQPGLRAALGPDELDHALSPGVDQRADPLRVQGAQAALSLSGQAYYSRALLRMRQGQKAASQQDLQQALVLEPNNPQFQGLKRVLEPPMPLPAPGRNKP